MAMPLLLITATSPTGPAPVPLALSTVIATVIGAPWAAVIVLVPPLRASLEEARPFDFCELMGLAPAYYRGLAFLQDNRPQQATKEFQRVVDHRAIAPTSLYVVLSQLELGRAFQLAGDRENAKRLFHNLTDIWKDADPDFPPLKQLRDYERRFAVQR
jgi:hypothetical protein